MRPQPAIELGNLKLALIEYARGRPLIWDRNVACSKKEREDAWVMFADGFCLPVQEIRKRWEGMRRMYFHELRSFLKTGKKSEWIYFTKLDTFLRKPVESLMEKFSVSKGTLNSDCIDITSSNDESEDSPYSYAAACKIVDAQEESKKKEIETLLLSSIKKASEERFTPSKSTDRNLEKKVESQSSSESSKACSSASQNLEAGAIFACSPFTGRDVSIKLETGEESSSENQADPDKSSTSNPLKLLTTEDVRNELRKIPPIKSTLLTSHPLKPKYPTEANIGGISTKHKQRPAWDDKEHSGSAPTPKSRLPGVGDSSWPPNKLNKPKPCPLSKKQTKQLGPAKKPSVNPTTSRPFKKSHPSQDSSKGKEGICTSSPQLPIAEDISEYATLNSTEDKDDGEPNKKKEKSNKRGSASFKDKMGEWRREARELPREKTDDSILETNSEAIRESRKNFLLSFLPDMDEMSSEQRKFFKSKLMNLICYQ